MKSLIGTLTILLFSLVNNTTHAQYWSATGAKAAAGAGYMIAACRLGNNIYGVGNNQTFVWSTDKGVSWTAPSITAPSGSFAALYGTGNRIYASIKRTTYDYDLYYSTDNGTTWTIDSAGLPQNITKTGKASVYVVHMGNGYVMAYNSGTARYKKLGDPTWLTTNVDAIILDIAYMGNDWYAIGANKILKSTDKGGSWSAISTSGLPANFQGNKLATNRIDRMFISTPPAAGGEDIYFSNDGGSTWTLTNSAGQYSHANPWVGAMYAVDDYVFAAVSPEFANFQDPPPYLMSSANQPSFSLGDTTGLGEGMTTTSLPFFFHVGDKLFTMMGDLYVSTPGFSGTMGVEENSVSVGLYPNPARDAVSINSPFLVFPAVIKVYNSVGEVVMEKAVKTEEDKVSLELLSQGLYIIKGADSSGLSFNARLLIE